MPLYNPVRVPLNGLVFHICDPVTFVFVFHCMELLNSRLKQYSMLASLEHAALFEQKMNQGCLSVSNEVWVCVPNYVSRYVLWCNIIYAWLTVNLFMVHSNNNNQYFFLDCYLQFYIYATYIYGTKVH